MAASQIRTVLSPTRGDDARTVGAEYGAIHLSRMHEREGDGFAGSYGLHTRAGGGGSAYPHGLHAELPVVLMLRG